MLPVTAAPVLPVTAPTLAPAAAKVETELAAWPWRSPVTPTKVTVTSSPVIAPTLAPLKAVTYTGVDTCEDDNFFRYLATRNGITAEYGCFWLSKRPTQIQKDCVPGSAVMKFCPETCGECVSTCKDDNTAILDLKSVRGKVNVGSNCAWLRRHRSVHALNCVPGSKAFDTCKDTCNNCGVIA